MKKLVVVAALVFCGACYQYTAFQPTPSTLGKAVRLQLNDAGTYHVASFVGPGADYLDGNLATLTDSAYTISLTALGRRNGTEEGWKGEMVTLARGDVESIALRRAAPGKSAALTAALVGGAALVARAIGVGQGAAIVKGGGSSAGQ